MAWIRTAQGIGDSNQKNVTCGDKQVYPVRISLLERNQMLHEQTRVSIKERKPLRAQPFSNAHFRCNTRPLLWSQENAKHYTTTCYPS